MDPAPSDADLLAELRAMHALDRGSAVALMNTVARNLGSRTMWEAQFKLVCEGKPSFVTTTSTGAGAGGGVGRWAGAGGSAADVGGGLFRGAGGMGDDALPAALQRHALQLTQPGVYSRPFLADPPAPAAVPMPGAGSSGESAAAGGAGASAMLAGVPPLLPPHAAAVAMPPPAVLPPLASLSALLAAPPPPLVKREEGPLL
jgi:hypothetical protein